MIPAPFAYHRPRSLDETLGLLAQLGEDARVVAGGHSLIPMMKLRLARPEHLVDLQDLEELRGIRSEPAALIIGAMTTQHELIGSELLAARCPIIRETALQIADPQVRYCGTLGGNVANGDPGNDMPAVMIALDAGYQLKCRDGEREVAARDFNRGAYSTALQSDEILVSISIPMPAEGHGHAYEKQKRKVGDYATAAAAVVLKMSSGACVSAAISLTNVGETPLFAKDAGDAVLGTTVDDAAISEAVRCARVIANPSADGHGSAEFRTHIAGVMVRRALMRAKERAVPTLGGVDGKDASTVEGQQERG
jgi:aerobic carbon-monoxide dehydrogenase medium subunit